MCLGSSSYDDDYDRRRPRPRPQPRPRHSSHHYGENIEMRTPRRPPRAYTGQSSSSHRRGDSHGHGHGGSHASSSRGGREDPYLSNALRASENPRNHLHDALEQLGEPTHGPHGRREITWPTGERSHKGKYLPSRNTRSQQYREPPRWDDPD